MNGGIFLKKRHSLIIVLFIMGSIFYLSSIPGLKVVPVLKQVNGYLLTYDISVVNLAKSIAQKLPNSTQLTPAKTASHDFYYYAKTNPVIIEYLLRKTAHIMIFFFLTLGVFLFVNQFSKKTGLSAIISYILSCARAFLDEYHQSFVSSRTGSLIDVGIDIIGVTFALFFILFSLFITKKYVADKRKSATDDQS